ncbi:MAG: IS110 family transposase [Steroidobacteraceae bacterium]
MNAVSTLGIDLAKNTFSVHGVDAQGVVTVRRTVPRAKLAELVAPYRKSGKNDGNDAEAICEAVGRPSMRFVPIKSVQQQSDLSLHRVRQGFVEERTATLNRIRGLITEFGYVVPLGTERLRREVRDLLERLPMHVAGCVQDLLEHAERLRSNALEYEREIRSSVQHNELARRAHTRPGIGPITASALVATVGNGHDFRNGRTLSSSARGANQTTPHGPLQRLLGGVQNRPPDGLWQSDFNEGALGIEIVATRLVNDSHVPEALGLGVGNGHVDLAPFQRHFVSRVIDANY